MKLGPVSSRASLFALTTVWGSTFVVVQSSLAAISPLLMVSARFALAAIAIAAIFPRDVMPALRLLPSTFRLALVTFAGFALQTVGLETTTPARSAFITALMVVFVPLVETIRTRRAPAPRLLVAVAIATVGIVVLFWPLGSSFVIGDGLTLLSAIVFGDQIVETTRLGKLHPERQLVLAQCLSIALLAAPCALFEGPRFAPGLPVILSLLYLALICTALNLVVLTAAQVIVPPTEASVIYTLEPVIASVLSVAIGREDVTRGLVVGGAIVLVASLVASLGSRAPAPSLSAT